MINTKISSISRVLAAIQQFPRLGLIGAVILIFMSLICICSMPYTVGQVNIGGSGDGNSDSSDIQSTQPRYNYQNLDAILLPPSWAPHSEGEKQRLQEYTESLDIINNKNPDQTRLNPGFWLGSDQLGRSFMVRCLAGGTISLGIGIAAAAIAVIIGTLYGMISGFAGGRLDAIMMRIVDVLYGLPYILLVVLLAVAIDGLIDRIDAYAIKNYAAQLANGNMSNGNVDNTSLAWWVDLIHNHYSLLNVITLLIAIGGVSWLTMARVIRGQVLSLKTRPFMEASRAIGVPVHRQLFSHILPNLQGPIIVYATLTVPQAILQESFLSFLGIGIKPPLPSWGNLAADGLSQLNPVESRWWLLLWPCLLLGVTLLALNFLGEGLRESFDPKRRRNIEISELEVNEELD